MSRVHAVRALALVSAIASWARPATAEPQTPVYLDYPDPAPGDCPPGVVFGAQLMARSHHLRVARSGDVGPRLVVGLTAHAGVKGAHGEISIRYPDGTEAKRSVDGETCESVVEALTLMSAMALDPTLSAPAPAAPPPSAEPEKPGEPPPPPPVGTAALDLEPGRHLEVGLGGELLLDTSPVLVPAASAFVQLDRVRPGIWSQSLRATLSYADSTDVAVTATGYILTTRTALELDGCPLRWAPGPMRITPCLHFEGGAFTAASYGVVPLASSLRPWFGAGGLVRVAFVFGHRFFVEVSGGVDLPWVRDRYYFNPDVTVYKPPAVSPLAGLALGFTIM